MSMIQTLADWDAQWFLAINDGLTNSFFDVILPILRNKYTWIPLYLFIVSFVIFNFQRRAILFLIFAIATIGLADTMSSKIIKKSVQRVRPCNDLQLPSVIERVRCGSGYSFTSSHATNHFAIGTFFMITLGFLMGRWRYLFLLWAGVISFAQIYVGVHYPLDVVGGAVVGGLCGLIGASFYAYFAKSQQLKSIHELA